MIYQHNQPHNYRQYHPNHQTNDKTRVAAAATPITRMSNVVVVIAPDVGREDELAEVDEGSGLELEEVTSFVAALPVPTPMLLAAVLVVTIAEVLEFGVRIDDGNMEIEETKEGAAEALEGSTSAPFPQKMSVPSARGVDMVAFVVAPVAEAIVNRPVQVKFFARGAVNW